jgi:hypothetical protein
VIFLEGCIGLNEGYKCLFQLQILFNISFRPICASALFAIVGGVTIAEYAAPAAATIYCAAVFGAANQATFRPLTKIYAIAFPVSRD